MISKTDVNSALKIWADGIVYLGSLKDAINVLKQEAVVFIDSVYAYEDMKEVLFKPTKASVAQFRLNKEAALSYFIGENSDYPEDKGFALHPWKNISFENVGYILEENRALVMGNYYFTDFDNMVVKAEYTFGFKKVNGQLKIDLHHSSFPYKIN